MTLKDLQAWGFTSSNDRRLLNLLKDIGFVDHAGVPQPPYREFKHKDKASQVMADTIRTTYADLFAEYPDAAHESPETLANWFGYRAGVGEQAARQMANTFKKLCSMASFDSGQTDEGEMAQPPPRPAAVAGKSPDIGLHSLTINVQIALPETADRKVYEDIFKAMKEYLLFGERD